MLFKTFIVCTLQLLDPSISNPSPSYPSLSRSRNQTFIKQHLGRMEKSRLTHGLTSEPKSPSPKSMNPRTTNLMTDGELSLSTTGILHSLNPPNHENHRHHHPLTMKINLNPNAHSRNLPIPDMQAYIGHFADPTIVLTTEEINPGTAKKSKKQPIRNRDHIHLRQLLTQPNSVRNDTLN